MTKKKLTDDQMQEGVQALMRLHSQRFKDATYFNKNVDVVEKTLAELEADEAHSEEEESNPVEARAKLFFDEITANFAPAWGKDAVQDMRNRYRYIARRSIQLEAEAVEDAVEEIDDLKGFNERLLLNNKELARERDELKDKLAKKTDCGKDKTCPKYLGQLISGCNKMWMKAEIRRLTDERDETNAKLDSITMTFEEKEAIVKEAVKKLARERDALKAKLEAVPKLIEERDELKKSKKKWEHLWRIENRDAASLAERNGTLKAKAREWERLLDSEMRRHHELQAKFDEIEQLVNRVAKEGKKP
jgi:hypothetical protein